MTSKRTTGTSSSQPSYPGSGDEAGASGAEPSEPGERSKRSLAPDSGENVMAGASTAGVSKAGEWMARGRKPGGGLYVVSTPIGNLRDITLRALDVLAAADLVLCEDTRVTRRLLTHYGLRPRLAVYNDHSGDDDRTRILARLAAGEVVALVSDAGTPLVSDPGERLVAAAIDAGHAVVAVPGPSAVPAALLVSGLPAAAFTFLGFPPRRKGERARLFAGLSERPETLVLFESPRRLPATLRELHEALGDRRACVARELTKVHEEVARGRLSELALRFADGARGEVTLVVAGAEPAPPPDPADVDAAIRAHLAAGDTPRTIAAALAETTGLPRRTLYRRALELRLRGRS